MSGNRTHQSAYTPHGYQPIVIDENCLSEEDRRKVFEAVDNPCDWMSYLTEQELDIFAKSLPDASQIKSPYFSTAGESSKQREKIFEMARLGTYRAVARGKYANAGRFWYGDGAPSWKRASE